MHQNVAKFVRFILIRFPTVFFSSPKFSKVSSICTKAFNMKPKNGKGVSKGSQGFNPKVKKEMKEAKESRNHNRVLQDDRFSRIATDPRFRGLPAEEKKVQIDERFKSMFTDKRFNQKHTVDKRGRPVNFASADSIQKFYELGDKNQKKKKAASSTDDRFKLPDGAGTDEVTSSEEGDEEVDVTRDFSRGRGNVESSSSEESSDDDEDGPASKVEEIEHPWAELALDAPSTDEITRRLALVNMDWENIRPEDLFALLNSFKPTNGTIESITIYPSEYGKEKMAEEGTKGPLEYQPPKNDEENEEEDDLDADLDSEEYRKKATEKLRKYQLNRLKYYYAVVVCDSKETANKIYEECDGLEYENSSMVIDLRFVPDDMDFDDSEAKSTVKNLPANYQPADFVSTALQQSKVRCSWDETARDRQGLGKLEDLAKMDDLQAYLASSSSEEEEEDDIDDINNDTRSVRSTKDPEAIERYRALILELDSKDKSKKNQADSDDSDVDLEVDWEPGLKSSAETALNEQKKKVEVGQLTPFEKILEKQKRKRKIKKMEKFEKIKNKVSGDADEEEGSEDDLEGSSEEEEEEEEGEEGEDEATGSEEEKDEKVDLELLVQDDKDSKRHFNLNKLMKDAGEVSKTKKKQLNKKRKAGDAVEEPEDDFEMNLKDERFTALFTSNQYNVDMSDPAFKKTKAMDALIEEKLQRVKNGATGEERKKTQVLTVRPEISSLAKSVQAKIKSSKK